jgi:multiple sugar transport system permease protein
MTPLARREALTGLAYISPWLLGFLVFTLLPMIATLGFSLTNLTLSSGANTTFVGLQNYQNMLKDRQIWSSLLVVFKFALIALPIGLALPLTLALLMNSAYLGGKNAFRALFYMPYVIPFVAAILVWGQMLNPEGGWINQFLTAIGVDNPPNWLRDTTWVYPGLVIIGLWGIGNAMLINLAALQGVPTELYDAARIDGAGYMQTLFRVTLPLISPVIFYNLLLTVVGLFQYFLPPLVIYQGTGAPGGATMFYNLNLYKTFFTYQNMAYGAAQAWLLFLIILLVTVILFRTSRYWVHYTSEAH